MLTNGFSFEYLRDAGQTGSGVASDAVMFANSSCDSGARLRKTCGLGDLRGWKSSSAATIKIRSTRKTKWPREQAATQRVAILAVTWD